MNAPDLPGVLIDVGELRQLSATGARPAHVLGYVGAVSEMQDRTATRCCSCPGFRIGKSGIEKRHDAEPARHAGTSQVEVNAVGRVIRELTRDEGEPGRDVS